MRLQFYQFVGHVFEASVNKVEIRQTRKVLSQIFRRVFDEESVHLDQDVKRTDEVRVLAVQGLGDSGDAPHYHSHVLLGLDAEGRREVIWHCFLPQKLKQAHQRHCELLAVQQPGHQSLRLLGELVLLLSLMRDSHTVPLNQLFLEGERAQQEVEHALVGVRSERKHHVLVFKRISEGRDHLHSVGIGLHLLVVREHRLTDCLRISAVVKQQLLDLPHAHCQVVISVLHQLLFVESLLHTLFVLLGRSSRRTQRCPVRVTLLFDQFALSVKLNLRLKQFLLHLFVFVQHFSVLYLQVFDVLRQFLVFCNLVQVALICLSKIGDYFIVLPRHFSVPLPPLL